MKIAKARPFGGRAIVQIDNLQVKPAKQQLPDPSRMILYNLHYFPSDQKEGGPSSRSRTCFARCHSRCESRHFKDHPEFEVPGPTLSSSLTLALRIRKSERKQRPFARQSSKAPPGGQPAGQQPVLQALTQGQYSLIPCHACAHEKEKSVYSVAL